MKKTVSFSLDEKSIEIIERMTNEQQDAANAAGLKATISTSRIVDNIIQDYDLFHHLIQQVKPEPISISEELERG